MFPFLRTAILFSLFRVNNSLIIYIEGHKQHRFLRYHVDRDCDVV